MLVTTSRKPGVLTKRLCRALAFFLPFGKYENRGKAGVGDFVEKARELGKTRLLMVYESHGNPEKIVLIEISRDSWEWCTPTLMIKGAPKILDSNFKQLKSNFTDATVTGACASELKKLFGLPEPEVDGDDDCVKISASQKELIFSSWQKKLSLKIEWVDNKEKEEKEV
ncbi:putative Brix domain-containing ribosomal biogenesis protein [Candidatus Gugararchaeum adminiculabundum]|nr:putative Brix domain-containing ribosomal biogenesis protein [Candidatus Gugararchaeum adminiculabundum]